MYIVYVNSCTHIIYFSPTVVMDVSFFDLLHACIILYKYWYTGCKHIRDSAVVELPVRYGGITCIYLTTFQGSNTIQKFTNSTKVLIIGFHAHKLHTHMRHKVIPEPDH